MVGCDTCGGRLRNHDRRKVFSDSGDDAPPGSYYYEYYNCPGGFGRDLLSGFAGAGGV